jgi:hypothetical protein
MVTLLLFALAIFSVIGLAIYFLVRSVRPAEEQILPPAPDFSGLFGEDSANGARQKKQLESATREAEHESLIARARNGDRSVLADAHMTGDPKLYDQVLNELVRLADSDPKLLALMSYVGTNEFRVTTELATAVLVSWQKSPDRNSTSKALHFAALSDDASVYRDAVEQALQFWRTGKLTDVSPVDLRALFEGEFWILSSRTRSSGAGFVLKRTLDSARRELEAAAGATQ